MRKNELPKFKFPPKGLGPGVVYILKAVYDGIVSVCFVATGNGARIAT